VISISRLALVAVVTVGIASPALAQSFDPDVGTGNIVSFSSGPASAPAIVKRNRVVMHQTRRQTIASRRSGLNAFARVPRSVYDRALTGGGSVG
jgi:hypothetical protein